MTATRQHRSITGALALVATLIFSACSSHAQRPAVAMTAVPGTPLPSLPPLTWAQKAMMHWHERGWYQISSTDSRVYMESPSGLQAVNAGDGSLLWRTQKCSPVGASLSIIDDELFTACAPEYLSILDADTGRILRSARVPMHGVNSVVVAGKRWLAVQGWDDGAALVSRLVILNRETLKPITNQVISDGTFLGVIGDRAFIDDWCCNGRADQYRPATIYSISLRDGTQSEPVDLKPDPEQHPASSRPLGQGEHNYMQGHYLFVPVDNVLYRYDILNLDLPPSRTQNR